MRAGVLILRPLRLLGRTSAGVIRLAGQPGVLILEAVDRFYHWRVEVDLDSQSDAKVRIVDRAGKIEERNVQLALGYHNPDFRYQRPRPIGNTSVPETIRFDIEIPATDSEGGGTRGMGVEIELWDDSPLPGRSLSE